MQRIELINKRLERIEQNVNNDDPFPAPETCHLGIDLGTADIVLIVTDGNGEPLAAFMEWADVVRDGIVLDYWGAIEIIRNLLARAEKKLGVQFERAIVSYPPGTDPMISENVVRALDLEIEALIDEPSSVCRLLQIDEGAVVDIGGGTTGIAVNKNHKLVYSADEPTGGRHVTLTIAGNRKITFEEAEKMKISQPTNQLFSVVEPVFRKMASIVRSHISDDGLKRIYLSGGTCCFPGIDRIFKDEFPEAEIIRPHNPLYLTPLAIASYRKDEVK